jgi:hypothetical protein
MSEKEDNTLKPKPLTIFQKMRKRSTSQLASQSLIEKLEKPRICSQADIYENQELEDTLDEDPLIEGKIKAPMIQTNFSQSPQIARHQISIKKEDALLKPKKEQELNSEGTMKRFQERFPTIHEPMIDYYNCALDRDFLTQGRVYFTTSSICFYAKLFGNEAKQIIFLSQIINLEKANTAGFFSNAIRVYTKDNNVLFR